jgi:predicted alpha/beta-hydrolase family hydrolase
VLRPLLLFAHGAGLPSSHPWMQGFARRLATTGDVVTFDYDYMARGKKPPDRMPKLLLRHARALDDAQAAHPEAPTILVGKSMGSRVGCHLTLEEGMAERIRALVCFGYPLVGANGKRRDEVLLALRTPILFIQGTRDRLCPLDVLAEVRREMSARNDLYIVESGDHSLMARKRDLKADGRTQEDVDSDIARAVATFAASVI